MVELRETTPVAPARISTKWPSSEFSRAVLLTLASLGIGICTWQFLSSVLFNPFLIPPPLEVIRTAGPMLASGEIASDVAISMIRVLVGFATGSLAGIVSRCAARPHTAAA